MSYQLTTSRLIMTVRYHLVQSVLKIGFVLAKKAVGRSGRVSARGAMHMAAALAGYRKPLVGTGWAISLLFDTNGWIRLLCLFRGSISGTVAFTGRRALTIVSH